MKIIYTPVKINKSNSIMGSRNVLEKVCWVVFRLSNRWDAFNSLVVQQPLKHRLYSPQIIYGMPATQYPHPKAPHFLPCGIKSSCTVTHKTFYQCQCQFVQLHSIFPYYYSALRLSLTIKAKQMHETNHILYINVLTQQAVKSPTSNCAQQMVEF